MGTCWVAAPTVVVTARHVVLEACGVAPVVWRPKYGDPALVRPGETDPAPPAADPARGGWWVGVEPLASPPGGDPPPVRVAVVVAEDAASDVAVLWVPGGTWGCVPPVVASSDRVNAGEPLGVAGFAVLDDPSRESALRWWDTTGAWSGAAMYEDSVHLGVLIASGLLPGLSGAPVIRHADGRVVGVVSGRYNSADGWARDTVWVTRTEDLATTWQAAATSAVGAVWPELRVTDRVRLAEPAEVMLEVEPERVRLRCAQLDVDVTAAHGGVTHRLVGLLSEVRRSRARAGSVRHQADDPTESFRAVDTVRVLGGEMTKAFLPGVVGEAVAGVVAEAEATTMPIQIAIHITGNGDGGAGAGGVGGADGLRLLPWEALQIPGTGQPVALHRLATVYRLAPEGAPRRVVPGPLTILVAIAAPLRGGGSVLDYESELRNVHAAVRGARAGQAEVRVVRFATTTAIRAALDEGDVHVLHLSGHGAPGVLVLQDEDGSARLVSAAEFVAEAVPQGKMPPLICLAACHTNTPGTRTTTEPRGDQLETTESGTDEGGVSQEPVAGFAAGLVAAGAPVVVGTETTVTDRYATRVFAQLYDDLAHAADPDPVTALSRARRTVQNLFVASSDPRDQLVGGLQEWGVVTVQAAQAGHRLFDPTQTRPRLNLTGPRPSQRSYGGLLGLPPGEFVGRRTEQHALPAVLTGHHGGPTGAQTADGGTVIGEPVGDGMAGVVLTGIGGIGKTTLAVEVLRRTQEIEPGTLVVAPAPGELHTDAIFNEVVAALRTVLAATGGLDQALPLLQALSRGDLGWRERLTLLQQNVLPQIPLVLVLDNFEDNLTPPPSSAPARAMADEGLAGLLGGWVRAPGRSRLLITSRYGFTLPDHGHRLLWEHGVGPLSFAETMKLAWALPQLDELPEDQLRQVWAGVGGHPRTLETLDALLARGHGRLGHIRGRLTDRLTHTLGSPDAAAAWLGQERDLDQALADAVTLAADDILLPDLLTTLSPDAVRLLAGLAVYRDPIDHSAILYAVGADDPGAAVTPDRAAAEQRVRELLTQAGVDPDVDPDADGGIDASRLDPDTLTALTAAMEDLYRAPAPPLSTALPLPKLLDELTAATLLTHIPHPDPDGSDGLRLGGQWFVHRWTASGLETLWADTSHAVGLPINPEPDRATDVVEVDPAVDRHTRAAGYWSWRVRVWPQDRDADIHDLLEARNHYLAAGDPDNANDATEAAVGNQHDRGHWDAEMTLITDHLTRLPPNHPRLPAFYHQLGILAHDRGDYPTAEERYQQSLDIEVRLGNQAGMASSYHQLGILAQHRGDYPTAEERYQQSLDIEERLGNQAGMASSYHQLGILAQHRGDYPTAEERYQQSLDIEERLGNQAGMASSYHQLGILAHYRGDYPTAEERYQQSLDINVRLGNQAGMATSYHQLGILAQHRGDYPTAEERYQQSLDINERLGNQAGMATSYHQLGILAQHRGDYPTAEERYQQSLDINERLGNQAGMASSYGQLGILAHYRGDYPTAEERYQQSLDIYERLGNQAGMATSYHQLGILAHDRGDYPTAEERYQQSLDINERLGNQAGMASSYHQLGILAQHRGDYPTAEERYQQSLDINERLGNQAGMASSYHQLGILAQHRGDYPTAEERYQQSLDINERLGNQAGMASNLSQLGILAVEQHQLAAAAEKHLRALLIRLSLDVPQAQIDWDALTRLDPELIDPTLDEIAATVTEPETAHQLIAVLRTNIT